MEEDNTIDAFNIQELLNNIKEEEEEEETKQERRSPTLEPIQLKDLLTKFNEERQENFSSSPTMVSFYY